MPASCCGDARQKQFDDTVARRDLHRFQRRGPDRETRELLKGIATSRLPDRPTLLDVGGGIGAIHHILLERGFASAVQVDASLAYLSVSTGEATRLGHGGRVHFRLGDFAKVADTVPLADVVTMDRVVCCDPDYERMLSAAASHARRLVAFSYPRARWIIRQVVKLSNAWRRLWRNDFRAFVHPPREMWAVLERAGLRHSWSGGTWIWAVAVFERGAAADSSG